MNVVLMVLVLSSVRCCVVVGVNVRIVFMYLFVCGVLFGFVG